MIVESELCTNCAGKSHVKKFGPCIIVQRERANSWGAETEAIFNRRASNLRFGRADCGQGGAMSLLSGKSGGRAPTEEVKGDRRGLPFLEN